MRYRQCSIVFLAAAVAAGVWSGESAANLDIDEMAAVLVLPVITGGQPGNPLKFGARGDVVIPNQTAVTLATVTNASSDSVILQVNVISGDVVQQPAPSDACQTESFICPLTGRETTTFVFTPLANGSTIWAECSEIQTDGTIAPNPVPFAQDLDTQNGIMVISVADPLTPGLPTVSQDVIFGDAIVVDQVAGQAYSFGAISFQAGRRSNDGDKVYLFNSKEYAKFPSALTTSFLAPGLQTGANGVQAELILFTLDFATGSLPIPRVALGGITYNDDEEWCDWDWEFDCFDVVALEDISSCHQLYPPADPRGLGSISGHLEMWPQSILTAAGDSHDIKFGNDDGSRKRGVHGWIVQNVAGTDFVQVLPGNQPIAGTPPVNVPYPTAWGRPLAQSTTDLIPNPGDKPAVFDAEPAGP
jgi:hypothetical protein